MVCGECPSTWACAVLQHCNLGVMEWAHGPVVLRPSSPPHPCLLASGLLNMMNLTVNMTVRFIYSPDLGLAHRRRGVAWGRAGGHVGSVSAHGVRAIVHPPDTGCGGVGTCPVLAGAFFTQPFPPGINHTLHSRQVMCQPAPSVRGSWAAGGEHL